MFVCVDDDRNVNPSLYERMDGFTLRVSCMDQSDLPAGPLVHS